MADDVPAVRLPGRIDVAVDELRDRPVRDLLLGRLPVRRRGPRLDPLGP